MEVLSMGPSRGARSSDVLQVRHSRCRDWRIQRQLVDRSGEYEEDGWNALQRFTHELARVISPSLNVPAPDVGTGQEDGLDRRRLSSNFLAISTYRMRHWQANHTWGINGRVEATGHESSTLQEFFRHPDDVKKAGLEGMAGKRIIIQGFGNVAYHAAVFLP